MTAPNQRTFSLNSREFYEAVCKPEAEPWIKAGSLPREPRWPRAVYGVSVSAERDDDAGRAFGEWLGHVEGRGVCRRGDMPADPSAG